ncbi:hypothetical protein BH09BAC6_BH09BAC6_28910 [soil metagenome]|jgi:hypothetical protein
MITLSTQRPTLAWKQQLAEGSDHFTAKSIMDSDRLLDGYMVALNAAQNEIELWEAVEKVVKGFDELNIKHNYFIDTIEREDLAEFIQHAAEVAGLNYDGDVTEEWRMEW